MVHDPGAGLVRAARILALAWLALAAPGTIAAVRFGMPGWAEIIIAMFMLGLNVPAGILMIIAGRKMADWRR